MAILFTIIIYKESKVITEITEYYGNLQQISKNLVKSIKKETKGTFSYEEKFCFHYFEPIDNGS